MLHDKAVYELVAKIPKGKVTTYGQIAKILNIKSARIVGRILHANKNPEDVPCHRVVFSNGKLSSNYAFGGILEQIKKLKNEGIVIINNRINIALYQYNL